ncbi:MAG: ribonuclease catalytic domain-containing protein [Neisseriaceae bacterium]
MSYVIISDGQEYKIAHLIETFKTHQQVEILPDNIRKKIKLEQTLYKLNTNDIKHFLSQIETLIPAIDTELLWDMIENTSDKISIIELSQIYFGDSYTEAEITSLLFSLAKQVIEFNNYKDGHFTKCTKEEQSKRRDILEKERKEQEIFTNYYNRLINFENPNFPEDINLVQLLNKPNKNSNEYKSLLQACKHLNLTGLELLNKIGLITDIPNFFVDSFLQEMFPNGINYNKNTNSDDYIPEPNLVLDLFSIDDKNTSEIDDAFSVVTKESGYLIGVHIAAPALETSLEEMVIDNISTIYYPGNKITMLPQEIIGKYSLWENTQKPVVSIYFDIDKDFQILSYYSKLEQVKINKNLRIEELELLFNEVNLGIDHNYPYETELKTLYKFANKLEEIRGKPSVNNLVVDYNFSFIEDKVIISPRLRGNPIDKLVSELMILANCTWGRMLTNSFTPAIYRVKQPNYPVKMTLHPDSHTGLNVNYYTWATSPLRRSADYINQHQIISLISNHKSHYTSTNPILLHVAENFDKKYAKYLDFQTKLERYWSLKYLIQENISEIGGTFIYKSKVQLDRIPIEIDTQGLLKAKPKGTKITVKILNINLTTLNFDFKIVGEVV